MSDRKEEIAATMSMITSLCISSNITLIAKEVKGVQCVVVQDALDGKEYVITKQK